MEEPFDWMTELRKQERSILWLARRTNRSRNSVYAYAWGKRKPPASWLQSAAKALGSGQTWRA